MLSTGQDDRLDLAADVMRSMPPVRPQGFVSAWPDYVSTFADQVGQEPRMKRPLPSPRMRSSHPRRPRPLSPGRCRGTRRPPKSSRKPRRTKRTRRISADWTSSFGLRVACIYTRFLAFGVSHFFCTRCRDNFRTKSFPCADSQCTVITSNQINHTQ